MNDGLLGREEIARRVPHQGDMCLLEQVLEWDATRIVCRVTSHRDARHPLREDGKLGALCAVEYAAQAMALHGNLLRRTGRPGLLAAVHDVVVSVQRLDDIPGALTVRAEKLIAQHKHALYQFALVSEERELVRGRAAVVFP